MNLDTMMAYSEVYEILNLLDLKYKEKVPNKIITFFEENKLKDYIPKIDTTVPLINQNLNGETIIILAILNLNYWCDSLEEKQELLNEFAMNEKEKQDLLNKYNLDNLFNNKKAKKEILSKQNASLIEYKKQGIFRKILEKIFNIFKKK